MRKKWNVGWIHIEDELYRLRGKIKLFLWKKKSLNGTLRECLCKSGSVDFAWDMDFARFLCVVRHSCTYTKTNNQFDRISLLFGVLRKSNFTRAKACRDTFQDFSFIQLWRTIYKKLRNSAKNKYHSHVYSLYLIYQGDFRKHHVSIKETGRLEWHLIGSPKSQTPKPIKFKVNFGKSEVFLTDPTNIARK